MNSRRVILMSLLSMTSVCGLVVTSQAETNLRLLSAWNPNNPIVPRIESVLIQNLTNASNGEIRITRLGPEVVPTFEQFQPLSAGLFDISFANVSYHQATTGVGSLLEATKSDPEMRRSTGVTKWVDDYYRKNFGVTFIAVIPQLGFQFLLREPIKGDEALKGRKIRTIPILEGITRDLGATPVSLAPQDIYPSLQKSMIDGAAFPAYAVAGFKIQEVVKYAARPTVGQSNVVFMMNAKKFDSLPTNIRRIVSDEARKMEAIGYQASLDLAEEDKAAFIQAGVQTTEFSPATASKIAASFSENIRSVAAKTTPDDVNAFYKFADDAHMLTK